MIRTAVSRPLRKTRLRDTAGHPSNAVTAIASLTRAFGHTGAQLVLWPGWWDASSALDNSGGTWSAIRTNQVGARFSFQVTGTRIAGAVIDGSWHSARNWESKQWKPNVGWWRVRRWTDGVAGAWVYGLRPVISDAGWIFAHDLDPAAVYRFDLEQTHFTDPNGWYVTLSNTTRLEYMREPSLFTPEASETAQEFGSFAQISGIVTTAGATFQEIVDARTPLNVLLLADSNAVGVVDPSDGNATVATYTPGAPWSTTAYDELGHATSWQRLILEAWCDANNRALVLHNPSYGGLWIADMDADIRAGYLTLHAGISSNVRDRYTKRTGYTSGAFPTFTARGRDNLSGYAPDLIVLAFVTNDQLINSIVYLSDPNFGGVTFQNNIVSLVNAMRTTWPSAKMLSVNNHRSDASVAPQVTSHTYFDLAHGAAGLNHSATNWLRYADIRALVSTATLPDGLVHLTRPQHVAIAAALQPTLNALMAL